MSVSWSDIFKEYYNTDRTTQSSKAVEKKRCFISSKKIITILFLNIGHHVLWPLLKFAARGNNRTQHGLHQYISGTVKIIYHKKTVCKGKQVMFFLTLLLNLL